MIHDPDGNKYNISKKSGKKSILKSLEYTNVKYLPGRYLNTPYTRLFVSTNVKKLNFFVILNSFTKMLLL